MRSRVIGGIGLGLWLVIGVIWAASPAAANPILTGEPRAAIAVGSGPMALLLVAGAAFARVRRRPAR